ncbi:hypothetical protein [uncultured Pontibacter sp.]|uniref:hypothetical protein n=1 Tax=uncultured Pontibacter sp. TaxID=453356 RepID=UPI002635E142|nr:hypothetical protein [uncultured Pontibacter sp.]
MTRKNVHLTIGAVFLLYFHTYAQEQAIPESPENFRKNAILATVGTVGLMGAYNLHYERMLLSSRKSSLQGLWAKAGIGGWGVWSSGGPYQSLMIGTMTGKNNSHFELNFGLARMVDESAYDNARDINEYLGEPQPPKSNYIHIRAVGTAGYRFQKPTSRFLFRCGAGYPETLYLGIGAAF